MQTSTKTSKLLRLVISRASLLVFLVAFLTPVFSYTRGNAPAPVYAATSSNLNYQARLLKANGSLVNDGYYNLEFKLYNSGSGGTSLWSEAYYDSNGATAGNDNRVRVVNGYISVNLGSQTAFPNINWDQDMWLTMNVGGTTQTATPTYDGEMNPRIKLTAVPYAFEAKQAQTLAQLQGANSGTLAFDTLTANRSILLPDASGTVCLQNSAACGFLTGSASDYIQNGTSLQTASNFHIQAEDNGVNGTIGGIIRGASTGQTVDLFQLQSSSGTVLSRFDSAGNLKVKAASGASRIDIQRTDNGVSGLVLQVDPGASIYATEGDLSLSSDNGGVVIGGMSGVDMPAGSTRLTIKGESGQTGDFLQINDSSSATILGITSAGAATFKNSTDSSAGFQVKSSNSTAVLTVNTTDQQVAVGSGVTGSKLSVSTGGGTALAAQHTGTGNILALSNSTADVFTVDNTGQSLFKNTADSTVAFQIQNTAGQQLLVADTTNSRLTVANGGDLRVMGINNPAAPTLTSSGTGGSLAAGTYYYRLSATSPSGETTAISSSPVSVTTAGTTSVNTVSWTAVTNAAGYKVYRSIDGGATWRVSTLAATATSLVDNGTNYTWSVSGTPPTFSTATGRIILAGSSPNSYIGSSDYFNYRPQDNGSRSGLVAGGSFYINIDSNNDQTNSVFSIAKDHNLLSSGTILMNIQESGEVGIGLNPTAGAGLLQFTAGTTAANGINFGSDTNLYRSAANELRTDDRFYAGNGIQISNGNPGGPVLTQNGAGDGLSLSGGLVTVGAIQANSYIEATYNTGTATDVVRIGKIGPGAGAASQAGILMGGDTSLYRDSANVLKTDDDFNAVGSITGALGTNQVRIGNLGPSGEAGILFHNSTDVNLYRSAANTLKTDDTFMAGSNLNLWTQGSYGEIAGTNSAPLRLNTWATSNVEIGTGNTSTNLIIGNNLNVYKQLNVNGAATFVNSTDSTAAFRIQDADGTPDTLFRADTTNNRIYVGNATAATGADSTLLVVDSAASANLPTGVNGGIIYDSTDSKFKIYENGAYKTLCNMTDLGCGVGSTPTLQTVYDNSSSPATIATTSATKDIIFKSGTGFNSSSLFQIQNASSQTLLVADTVNQRVAVGPAAVPANGVLTVGADTTAASGGLYFGTDTNLYRSAANTLKTDDAFTSGGLLTADSGALINGGLQSQRSSATDSAVLSRVTGDAVARLNIQADGRMDWGTGALAADTSLYRSGVGALAVTGQLQASSYVFGNAGANQVQIGGANARPEIIFGSAGDTVLYRSNASELKTDDALIVASLLTGQAGATISGGTVNLNASSNFATNINTGTSTGTVTIGNNTGNTNITIDSGTGAINIGTGSQSRPINIGTGVATQSVTIGSTNTSSSTLIQGGTGNITILSNGASNTGTLVKNTTNSSLSFQIQSSGSDRLFSADTSNNRVYVGNATASTSADSTLLVIDSASTANLPTGVNGGMVYDSTTNKFKIYENGAYKTLCNMTDLGCGAGATVTMQVAYDNSTSPATITTSSATKDIIFKSGTGFNSASLFQIQNASSQNLFVADTVNQRVAIGPAAVPANGVLTIGTSSTTAASGGIYFGTDVTLYRSAADTLKTDDALIVASLLTGQAGATISGGTVNLNASSNFATNINTGTSTGAVSIGNSLAGAISVQSGSTLGLTSGASSNINLTAGGTTNTGVTVTTSSNSTAAFQVQSSGAGDTLFRVDTTNNRLYVGNATAASGADSTLLVLDSATTTNLPSGVNGGIIYDSTANKFKVYENGQYKTLCNTVDAGCGAAGINQTMQDAYNNSGTPATITSTSSTKDIIFKSGSSFDSTSLFQVQSSGSDVLFRADTVNNRVYVGNATASAGADSTLFVVDSSSTTNLPTGVNGGIIYDSTTNKFKVYENGQYKTLCNTTDLACGAAGVAQSLQDAYNNSGSPALITTSSATKDFILRSGTGFNSTSVFQIQNASSETLFVADTVNQRIAVGPAAVPGNGILTIGINTSAASGGLYFGTDTNLYRGSAGLLRSDGSIQLAEGTDRTFNVQGRSTNAAGNGLTISAGDAGAGGSAFAGGTLTLQGGNAAGTGNANGGNVLITGGTGTGTGTRGLVVIDTPAFTTSTNTNCAANCTISQTHIDNSGAVIVNATTTGLSITMPDPGNMTAGRIVYITASTGSNDFTLIINGGGTGNEIAMRQNTSATMIWNGTDWTAAGASSSTTLQAAYNNTLTSAGAAEIILNNTASSDGLTIRNNMSNPIMGSLFEVQSSIGTNLLSVNNRAVEYVSNGGAETAGASSSTFPASTWSAAPAGGTVSRHTNLSNVATGQASVEVVTTAANHGIKNQLTQSLATNTTYQVSFTGKLSSGTFTTLDVYYSRDGGSALAPCATAQAFVTTGWSKITCTFTTDSSAATDPIMIIRQSDGTGRTFWIDNLSVTLSTTVSTPPNVQIGGGIFGGTPTLLTLDRSSSPPVANGNDVYYGSMYYDTTSGRIQCYEADGWGACGSAPDNFVNLVPEYAGAVLNGSGVGTMSADFCANSGPLSVNSSLCASGQALNFYRWTSPQATQQTYSVYVTYQLPAAFKHFANDNTVTLTARTDNVTNAQVTYQMYRSEGGSLTACGTETTVTTSANTWQTVGINGNEYSGCGFSTSSANNNVIFKINVKANSNANAYVGTLSFTSIGQ